MGRTRYSGPVKSTAGFEVGAAADGFTPETNTPIIDSSGNLYQAGTLISATADELNRVADKSASVVVASGATLTVTEALHGDRIITMGKTTGTIVTLPAATGTGNRYTFIIAIAATSNNNIIKVANATDVMEGLAIGADDDTEGQATAHTWNCETGDDTITMSGTATGGKLGDKIEVIDYASGKFHVNCLLTQSGGSEVTPFSATVS